jgi:hypothetical protein
MPHRPFALKRIANIRPSTAKLRLFIAVVILCGVSLLLLKEIQPPESRAMLILIVIIHSS